MTEKTPRAELEATIAAACKLARMQYSNVGNPEYLSEATNAFRAAIEAFTMLQESDDDSLSPPSSGQRH